MKYIIITITSYFIGCFSSAYVVGKIFKNIDIRNYGSGNVGSTNALRTMGVKLGIFTFILDILKGVLAVYIGKLILGDIGGAIAAVFVVVGHNWPIFIGFKGGKGIATSIGSLLTLFGVIILIPLIITGIIIFGTKYVSLGSISFLLTTPIICMIFVKPFKIEYYILFLVLASFGIIRHKDNIIRLIQGKENKIKIGR